MCLCVCMFACACVQMHDVCIYMQLYVHTCMCVHMCMCINACVSSHIQTINISSSQTYSMYILHVDVPCLCPTYISSGIKFKPNFIVFSTSFKEQVDIKFQCSHTTEEIYISLPSTETMPFTLHLNFINILTMFRQKGCFLKASTCLLDVLTLSAVTPVQNHPHSTPLHSRPHPHSSVEKVIKEHDLLVFKFQL